jgi:hypothetical protein
VSELPSTARDEADAKAWFYLDNRADIEVWAALRAEGRQLMDKHLIGAAIALEELAEEFGAEFQSQDLEMGPWPRMGLRRSSWSHEGVADVSVVLQWERARMLTPGPNEWPYVAVRLTADLVRDDRRKAVTEAMKPVRARLSGNSSRIYPFWRYVPLADDGPVDLDVFLADVTTAFRQLWEEAAPDIDGLYSR